MEYVTKKQIINTNRYQVDTFGGNFVPPYNFLHEENLDYLLEAVQAEIFGEPLYPEIHHKAGLYMFNIVCNHIFQDGNKRTGLQVALIFLFQNGYSLKVDDDTIIDYTLSVASGEQTLEDVQDWFQANISLL